MGSILLEDPSRFAGVIDEINFAYDRVPAFRELLKAHSVRPSDVRSATEFRELIPATRKAYYREGFPARVLASGRRLGEPHLLESHSSGTGGERLVSVSHTYDLAERMRATIEVNPPISAALTDVREQRICRYAAPNCSDVECANPRSSVADRILVDGTLVLPVGHDLLATPESMRTQAIRELEEYDPDWLYTDATHLAFMVREMRLRQLPAPDVRAIVLTYTQATASARRQIASFFPDTVPIAEVVSMSEVGWVAAECHHGSLHLNNHSYYVELLRAGEPAQPGELGELHLTSLGDRVLPHIRYRTGDIYRRLSESCSCGHPHPAVRFEGRLTQMVSTDGEIRATAKEVDDLVGRFDWIDLYRLHQRADTSVSLEYLPSGHEPPDAELRLRTALGGLLEGCVDVDVRRSDYLPGSRSGKFISCLSDASGDLALDGRRG